MSTVKSARTPLEIAGITVAPGERCTIDIPISRLSNHAPMNLSVEVIHGKQPGPTVFVCAAVHGDEVLGVEIIRRLSQSGHLTRLHGTLLLVPIVNAYGFIANSRYLPDRRDLNRSFPGNALGSLASQLADTFMREIVARSDAGIDLHTGAVHRANLPQVRGQIAKKAVKELASAFGAPIVLNAKLRDGSLRAAAAEHDCDVLVYEAGEALRFDERAIRIGMKGVLNTLRKLEMLAPSKSLKAGPVPIFSQSSFWVRSTVGGVMRAYKTLGQQVAEGDALAIVSGPLGENAETIVARADGVVIGQSNLPVVNRGDALFHIARVFDPEAADAKIEMLGEKIEDDPMYADPGAEN